MAAHRNDRLFALLDSLRMPEGRPERWLLYLARLCYLYLEGRVKERVFEELAREYAYKSAGARLGALPEDARNIVKAVADELRRRGGKNASALAALLVGEIDLVERRETKAQGGPTRGIGIERGVGSEA